MQRDKQRIIVAEKSLAANLLMKNLLEKQGYTVYAVSDGLEARELIKKVNPNLIILDIMMPKISGLDLCKELKSLESTRLIPVIILTASDSKEDKNMAISVGANDYLNKPYDKTELTLKVESLLKLKGAIDELESISNIILALTRAVEAKDQYAEGHAERVSLYSSKIARKLMLSEQQIQDIIRASMLHDIGKIGIPDSILNKPSSLSDSEHDLIKQHAIIGEEICGPIKSFSRVKRIVRHHHEKLNGSGYPDGLAGDAIDIETRIVAVADNYDALTSNRVYRKALDDDTVFSILKDSAAKGELDGEVVGVLEDIIKG